MTVPSSVTYGERPESRRGTAGQSNVRELLYWVKGTSDEAEALECIELISPKTFRGLVRQDIDYEVVYADATNRNDGDPENYPGKGLYNFTVRYGLIDAQYTFGTAGGTQHITQSLETVASYPRPGETAPDFKGAIGVTKDNIEGVDVPVPSRQWTETYALEDEYVTDEFKDLLEAYTGCVNSAAFQGFLAGEVRFEGATLRTQGRMAVDDVATAFWELVLSYQSQPNQTYITIGDIEGIEKDGWDYLWVRYMEEHDEDAAEIVKVPKAAYVERVLPRVDLNDLYVWPESS